MTKRNLIIASSGRPVAPVCLSDAHIGNFGVSRDEAGRLIWGVDDLAATAQQPLPMRAGELLRLDGRDYIDRFSSTDFARLYGHPAGYRGYGDVAGLLDSAQRGSFAVILLDSAGQKQGK
jgi:hypothetical protein